ncbi:unnamed protein product [Phyllotreta striolata]|uniref:Nose resistant-to-fluoxetine protein N-terminal domain-containing protein n=1 Tax=Phyllotreta striolata TaxID=444603 RepID=A0A9N9XRT5_PHYSR|nr:unnamed protein product [Phyllotreta striolata]
MSPKVVVFCFLMGVVQTLEINVFPTLPIILEKSENELCDAESRQYLENLNNFTLWAHEMRDSCAQTATGVLRGNGYNMGNMVECLTANAPFPTQYCLVILKANVSSSTTNRDPLSLEFDPNGNVIDKLYDYKDITKSPRNTIRMGWCAPASCNPRIAQKALNDYVKNHNYLLKEENVSFSVDIPAVLCKTSTDESKWDNLDVAFCVVTITLLLIVGVGTTLDYRKMFKSNENSMWREILVAFSAIKSYQSLTKRSQSASSMRILFGIKSLAFFGIIGGHRLCIFINGPMFTEDYLEHLFRSPLIKTQLHVDLLVDTFFFIGGLLVTYGIMDLLDKNRYNPSLLVLLRYLRLTPIYAYIIFFHATLLYRSGSGVLWETVVGAERKNCRENWWTGILYISNIVNSNNFCIISSWYLSCDFHFFLLAIILVYVLHKNNWIGFAGLGVGTLLMMAITFYLTYAYRRPAMLRFYKDFLANPMPFIDFQLIYIKSYTRGAPYFVGICAGYLYHKLKDTDFNLSKKRFLITLFASYLVLIAVVLASNIFYDPYHEYNAVESSFFGSTFRLIWAIGTFGFVFAVSFGPHGILYNFLSWSNFEVLAKLTYGAYLVHIGFQYRDVASSVAPGKFWLSDMLLTVISDAVWCFILSFGLYLAIEQPFKALINVLIMGKKKNFTLNIPVEKLPNKFENSKL